MCKIARLSYKYIAYMSIRHQSMEFRYMQIPAVIIWISPSNSPLMLNFRQAVSYVWLPMQQLSSDQIR